MKGTTEPMLTKPRSTRTNMIVALVVTIAVAIVGYTLFISRALGPFAALEPENGSASTPATVGLDPNASGGKYLQFGAGGPTVPPPPPATGAYWSDYYKRWPKGLNANGDPNFYPIGVWQQTASRLYNGKTDAQNYSDIGINFNIADVNWPGDQPAYDAVGWKHLPGGDGMADVTNANKSANNVGYMIDDEADMNVWNDPASFSADAMTRRSNLFRGSYKLDAGGKIIIDSMTKLAQHNNDGIDASRPTYANYGKPMVAPDGFIGYRYQNTYEADMKTYCDAVDLVSGDYYGYTDPNSPGPQQGGWTYGGVIDNLREHCGPNKPLWGFVDTNHSFTNNDNGFITADQMEIATWNMVVHGANGIIYFAHHFNGAGLVDEDGMLHYPDIAARAAQINAKLKSLAPILNSYTNSNVDVSATSTNNIPVTTMYKVYNNSNYVFAMADGNSTHIDSGATTGTISVPVTTGTATVMDENRTVQIVNGKIVDNFSAYQRHIYKF